MNREASLCKSDILYLYNENFNDIHKCIDEINKCYDKFNGIATSADFISSIFNVYKESTITKYNHDYSGSYDYKNYLLIERNSAGKIFPKYGNRLCVLYTIESEIEIDNIRDIYLITEDGEGKYLCETNITNNDFDIIDVLCRHLLVSYYGYYLVSSRDNKEEQDEIREIRTKYYKYRFELISRYIFDNRYKSLCKIINEYLNN